MTQLIRINLGDDIEEDHMVNRQWVSAWSFEQGKKENVIEMKLIRKLIYNNGDNKVHYRVLQNIVPPLHSKTGQWHTLNLYIFVIPNQFHINMQDFRSPT